MTKSITLSEPNWATLQEKIRKDYPKSVWLVRGKMRLVLGFVPREHKEWCEDTYFEGNSVGPKYQKTTIHLDFYDDRKKTMFIMKYSEYLDGKL